MRYKQKHRVQEHFERSTIYWNDIYTGQSFDALHFQTRLRRVIGLVDQISLKQGTRVLDLGCGAGLATLELSRRKYRVQAMDISENMLRRAQVNCQQADICEGTSFIRGDADSLPFPDNTIDLVVSIGLIGYMSEWRDSIREMVRVTKPDGYLIFTFQNKLGLSHLANPRKLRLGYFKELVVGNVRLPGTPSVMFFKPYAFQNILRDLGMEILTCTSHGFGPFRPMGQQIFPGRANLIIHSILQKLSDRRLVPYLHLLGKTCIILTRKLGKFS